MILIADSGSTKTHWCIIENGEKVKTIFTEGINPYFQTQEEIKKELILSLFPKVTGLPLQSVIFYGAGCLPERKQVVRNAIAETLQTETIEVHSDLLAAAHALCGREAGIACILGTGSNSCFYDGKEIVSNVSSLGFILGDEGSGAALGKTLVGDLLKNQLPEQLKEAFLIRYNLSVAEIIDRVYRKPFPNRFLAGFTPFLIEYIDLPQIQLLVRNCFRAFFQRNVAQYDYHSYNVHLMGSVAFFFQDLLKKAAEECGMKTGKIMRQPMDGLIDYHSKK
ncbi:MAG: ATPase [Massilibacteroides sp.]|nr:ATPase [Massilibacteroides sp.]MDD3062188.1 ATPase [Massilibacteroides sp.]MDD4114414.1 ATPase [Massilibacteroides sp.]MDD4659706.1 ATPase [Massilibacteroides sp.]